MSLGAIKRLNPKKATGFDQIPPKLVKIAGPVIAPVLVNLINASILANYFPDELKVASVVPVFKKDDRLSKGNYRPVSVLPCLSKIYERVMEQQISKYFSNIFISNRMYNLRFFL